MIPERYSLADVDGVLCVRFTTTDFCNPSIVTHYWPTVLRSTDATRFFFEERDTALLEKLECKRTMPGEYFIGVKDHLSNCWKTGQHVRLEHGGATQPVKTDVADAKQPKVRKGTMIYWSNGVWVKHTSKGVEKIDPLAV